MAQPKRSISLVLWLSGLFLGLCIPSVNILPLWQNFLAMFSGAFLLLGAFYWKDVLNPEPFDSLKELLRNIKICLIVSFLINIIFAIYSGKVSFIFPIVALFCGGGIIYVYKKIRRFETNVDKVIKEIAQ